MEEARYLDRKFTGFVPLGSRLSRRAERRREKTKQIVDIPEREKQTDAFPTFDLILTPNLSFNQIVARLEDTTQDPETGILYHPIGNPAPEGDKKLRDRLVKYEFDPEYLEQNFHDFSHLKGDMQSWYSQFGWRCGEDLIEQPLVELDTSYIKQEPSEENQDSSAADGDSEHEKEPNYQFTGLSKEQILNLKQKIELILD
jgi:hypothetical protein